MASVTDGSSQPEQALDVRLVVDTIPALAWSSAPDGSADFVNQRWCGYTGLSPEESYGRGWETAIHPDDLATLMDASRSQLLPIAGPHLPPAVTTAFTPWPVGPNKGSCGTAAFTKKRVIICDISEDPRWPDENLRDGELIQQAGGPLAGRDFRERGEYPK